MGGVGQVEISEEVYESPGSSVEQAPDAVFKARRVQSMGGSEGREDRSVLDPGGPAGSKANVRNTDRWDADSLDCWKLRDR
ncbi:hypothetical protein KPH14_008727 [Odynerus spinipes]|uniref:Uncharacterized protein n=1 Tax=Odynerus spinipes TaxID=1348599 RepID=A0AAD9R8B0_9HYME|nr:hypothetical protein KPH14_008727 [Odynerus spinipes]